MLKYREWGTGPESDIAKADILSGCSLKLKPSKLFHSKARAADKWTHSDLITFHHVSKSRERERLTGVLQKLYGP